MGGAIGLKSTNDTARHIRALWQKVGLLEKHPSMTSLDYPPHFTFAIYDAFEPDVLKRAADKAFSGHKPVCVCFGSIRYFDADPLVLWAAPNDVSVLSKLHSLIHSYIDPVLCHLHYRPGVWIPHCTLGTQIPRKNREKALSFTQTKLEPFEVVFDVADCIEFPPIEIAAEYFLHD